MTALSGAADIASKIAAPGSNLGLLDVYTRKAFQATDIHKMF